MVWMKADSMCPLHKWPKHSGLPSLTLFNALTPGTFTSVCPLRPLLRAGKHSEEGTFGSEHLPSQVPASRDQHVPPRGTAVEADEERVAPFYQATLLRDTFEISTV